MAQPSLNETPPVEAPAAATPVQDAPRNPLPQDVPETDFGALLDAADNDSAPAAPVVDLGVTEPATPAPVTPAPPTEVVVSAPPPAQPQVAVPPVPPASAPTVPVVVAQPPVTPQVPSVEAAPIEPVLTEEQVKVKRGELISAFASNYRLSEDDKVKLQSDPDEVLPRLAGNIAVDVLESVTRVILGQVPQMIHATMQQTEAARGARDAFFGEFPDLNKPEYVPTLQQVTQMYRQMNPNVPYAAATKAIGQHARIMLGLAATPGQSPAAPPAQPPKPAMPLQPGAAASRPPTAATNEWEQIATYEPIDT
jgi:hypothetical protein